MLSKGKFCLRYIYQSAMCQNNLCNNIFVNRVWNLVGRNKTPFLVRRYMSLMSRIDYSLASSLKSNNWHNYASGVTYSVLTNKRLFSYTNHLNKKKMDEESEYSFDVESIETNDAEYEELARQWLHVSDVGHQLLVIQPYIKWGAAKKHSTTPDLQLAEAVALVHSLPKWVVLDKMTIALRSFEKKTFFGLGNFEMLKYNICKDQRITAVFISTHMLHGIQHRELEDAFGVPVFDRYTVVMQIFRERAVTKEAKLQVAMAEIPYLWSRLKGMHAGTTDKQGGGAAFIGGAGETFIEVRKRLLSSRENKLRQTLQKLRGQRELLRNKRTKQEYPVVAVIGYTNAGKTSLIQALTGDSAMQPENKLFATLDVTMHLGILPCHLKILYVDTIGFISDIPTNLIESFVATLEDAIRADVIIHVRDISHPDTAAQAENVMAALHDLNLSPVLMQNIVVAGNKADLVDERMHAARGDWVPVSATKRSGLSELLKKIEEAVLKSTGRTSVVIRVPMGGPEASWLYKEAAVTDSKADPKNSQYLLMKVIISHGKLKKFQHHFTT